MKSFFILSYMSFSTKLYVTFICIQMAGESEDNNLQSYSPKNETGSVSPEINLGILRKKVRKYIDMVRCNFQVSDHPNLRIYQFYPLVHQLIFHDVMLVV